MSTPVTGRNYVSVVTKWL